ncbi:MAG TPA: hypothetical protein VI356_10300 [Myxococcales bacterium]
MTDSRFQEDGRSHRARMLAGDMEPGPRRAKWEASRPIAIGGNVWPGGGAIVCPGVSIGDKAAVGAAAVVVRDQPANVVAVGNPARIVRRIEAATAPPHQQ